MDGIDYTPPTTQEREFLDWALEKHKEKRNAGQPVNAAPKQIPLLALLFLLASMQEGQG